MHRSVETLGLLSERINIYLTVDTQMLASYFNIHDPAPIYMRKLSHHLEEYIINSVKPAKRYSPIFYKLKCTSKLDEQYTMPLMYAIRRHYSIKKAVRIKEFEKFKKRNWILLGISVAVVILCHVLVPMLLNPENTFHSGLGNSLDIFSWVLLWRPIDTLLFSWNPFLKDISLLNKLASSEAIIMADEN
jgi:hypothetical protein